MLGTVFHYAVIEPVDHAYCDGQRIGVIQMHERMGYRPGGAYNGHFCQHGQSWVSYTGPNQATGNTWANLNLHAWCWLGGPNNEPTDLALNAAYSLTLFEPSGRDQMYSHHQFYATACSGPMRPWVAAGCPAPATAPIEEESGDMEYLVKNVDNGEWFYFPPFCAPARVVDGAFVLGRASFIPHGDSNGPTIVAMDQERALHRTNFVNQVAATVPAGGGGGVTEAQVRAIVVDVVDGTTLKT